jgi:hypothetical protein
MPEMRTWETMREQIVRQLERQTGDRVETWNAKIAEAAPKDEVALRVWLGNQAVTGYPQMLLVWETFGYPDFLVASADDLVEAQYADRPDLRPVFDAIIAAVSALDGVDVQARKTYVSLLTPRRTFAVVQATTKKRVDVGLRLDGLEPEGRLQSAKGVGNEAINVRIPLASIDDLDAEALTWIRRAHEQSV